MNCSECTLEMRPQTILDVMPNYRGAGSLTAPFEGQTLVGYESPEGHEHDDNCLSRVYVCGNGHERKVSKRRSCPACDWKGKTSCSCHPGEKVDTWP